MKLHFPNHKRSELRAALTVVAVLAFGVLAKLDATIQLFHTRPLMPKRLGGSRRGQGPYHQEIQLITGIGSANANIDLYEILIISFVVPSRIPMQRVSLTRARTGGKIFGLLTQIKIAASRPESAVLKDIR